MPATFLDRHLAMTLTYDRLAVILIASLRRWGLITEKILPSLFHQGFDDILVVGDFCPGEGYRYLPVPKITGTTVDALIKRDVGTLATEADVLVYLSDDHMLSPNFGAILRQAFVPMFRENKVDVLVPGRSVWYIDKKIPLNMGQAEAYCGGHAGVFHRRVIQAMPWTTGPHHPNWDLLISHEHQRRGFSYLYSDVLEVWDVEPEGRPWE